MSLMSTRSLPFVARTVAGAAAPFLCVRSFRVTATRFVDEKDSAPKTNALLTQLPDAGFEYRDEWSFTYKDGKPSAAKDVLTKGKKEDLEQAADVMMRELELLKFKVVDIERKYQKLKEQLPEEMFQQLLKEAPTEALKPSSSMVAAEGEFDQ
eukprot:comp11695_c0_seq1/m.6242 comp11695_c0_seq1/g.6242  ORF comp11695_c0_seq1/g.6242 comp11695_c0_seq1/m.6242 type:complete len:153 (-) comp11695_c0_seq1:173-631(-)